MRDGESFDEFYRGTSRRLLHYAYALTGDLSEAQDLVQEVYVRAWQRWRRISAYDSAESWLRLVLARLATDRWRRLASFRSAMTRSGPMPSVDGPGDDTVVLVRALRRLPESQRRAIALHYLYDLSVDDIATETSAATGTVKSWLSRGRAALAEVLGAEASEVK
jgi:RNA polymerase sigma-70 factor, ECF subfamily